MMPGFRRAQLKGSEELFRPTDHESVRERPIPVEAPAEAPSRSPAHLVRLTREELDMLIEAVQAMKFPHKTQARPSVLAFEQLEELRQKLLSIL